MPRTNHLNWQQMVFLTTWPTNGPSGGILRKNFQATRTVKQIPTFLQTGTDISCNLWRWYLCNISLRWQKYQCTCTSRDPDCYSEARCSLFPSLRNGMEIDPMEKLSCTSLETVSILKWNHDFSSRILIPSQLQGKMVSDCPSQWTDANVITCWTSFNFFHYFLLSSFSSPS